MHHNKSNDDVQDRRHEIVNFGGIAFTSSPDGVLYKPIAVQENNAGTNKQAVEFSAIPIRTKRDWFDVAGTVLALFTFLVVAAYTWFAARSWQEMKRAADASAQATETAVCALDENRRQFKDTLDQIKKQTTAQQGSADAAQNAAITAKNSLILSNRPWIRVKQRIIEPLTFGIQGAAGSVATMTVEDTLENVGNGVALNVLSWEDVIPVDGDISTTTARNRRNEWCNANKRFDPKSLTVVNGSVLFPRDPLVQNSHIGPLMSTVNKAVTTNNARWNRPNGQPSPLEGKVAFVLVGCVVYRSPVDPDGTRPHVTGFMYRLGVPFANGGMNPFVIPQGTAKELMLIKFPDGDFAY